MRKHIYLKMENYDFDKNTFDDLFSPSHLTWRVFSVSNKAGKAGVRRRGDLV